MKLKNIITGPIFLLLYAIVSPLKWALMVAFINVLKLHTWICTNLNKTLNIEP